jgi:inward rectifier potassium channel
MGTTGPPSDRDGSVDGGGSAKRNGSDIDLDLGFGKFVSSESHRRLVNRDGTFNVRRTGLGFFERVSVYHFLLEISWPRFLGLAAVWYIFANAAFAGVFVALGPEALDGLEPMSGLAAFFEAFFFSVHTFATIGYGDVTPASWQADLVVTLESLVGLLSFGLAAGLMFARFARPNARIIFSRNAVIAPYRGGEGFEFRIINSRKNQIIEVTARVILARRTTEGGGRSYYELPLEREKVAIFPLSWTIVHPIEDSSPLAGLSLKDLQACEAEFLVLLTGFDETFAQTVHARSSYRAEEVVYGARFDNMFDHDERSGLLGVDLGRVHDVLPAPLNRDGNP